MLLLEREPRLQIILHRSRQIQRPAHDPYDLIPQPQTLIKLFAVPDHPFQCIPTLLGVVDDELFYFLKLVDTEDTPHISTGGTGFFAETG